MVSPVTLTEKAQPRVHDRTLVEEHDRTLGNIVPGFGHCDVARRSGASEDRTLAESGHGRADASDHEKSSLDAYWTQPDSARGCVRSFFDESSLWLGGAGVRAIGLCPGEFDWCLA